MAAPTPFIADSDLHGLVDGHIEPERRSDALRRLAASPADRARVEAWQAQNDLLRGAFAGVDREPLPVLLDLKAKPRLHCVPANDAPMAGAMGAPRAAPRRTTLGLAVATLAVIAAGLGSTWIIMGTADPDDPTGGPRLRGSVDATIAGRAADSVGRVAAGRDAAADRGVTLPTAEIPDLRAAGLSFAGAETNAVEPPSIQFRYRGGGAERVVVTVARAAPQDAPRTPPVRIGNAYSWHRNDNSYAIAGTLPPARLREIAISLLDSDPPE